MTSRWSSWVEAARALYAEGGLEAVREQLAPREGSGLEEVATDPVEREADETHGWDALARGRDGWAVACFQVAADTARASGAETEAARLEGLLGELLRSSFPAYGSDEELLDDVGAWLRTRLAALRAEVRAAARGLQAEELAAPEDEEAVAELHQLWALRLIGTRREGGRLAVDRLAARLGLDGADQHWVLGLLAAERDPVFQALRRRWFNDDDFMSAGLMARLLADDAGAERALLARLDVRQPLIHHRLVYLNTPAARPHAGLRHRLIELDDCASAWVEGRPRWPPGIDDVVTWYEARDRPGQEHLAPHIQAMSKVLGQRGAGAALALCGPTEETCRTLALAWGAVVGRPLLHVSARRLFTEPAQLERLLRLVMREALLRDAAVMIEGKREWSEGEAALAAVGRCQAHFPHPVIFDGPVDGDEELRRTSEELYEIRIFPPSFDEQLPIWNRALEVEGLEPLSERQLRSEVLDIALHVEDIHRAVRLARFQSWLRAAEGEGVSVEPAALRAMATSKLQSGLHGIAERVSTHHSWNDIVLPEEVFTRLMEIVTYQRYRRQVYEEWGFGAKMAYGRANSSLFTGPPGTGKTMAAGLIAHELGMDLYRVDLSQIVSKFVGETEKNLARVFDEAKRAYAVLLFDEADSLFAKRTNVESVHDRYSNLEVNYLLQRIESFDGVTILTSNFPENIDDAFARRIKIKVEFPFPGEEERAKLWEVMVPKAAEASRDIEYARLARTFELAGGHIKNAVLRAAFMAAEAGGTLAMEHLEGAGVLECREAGKLVRFKDGRPVPLGGRKGAARPGDIPLDAHVQLVEAVHEAEMKKKKK